MKGKIVGFLKGITLLVCFLGLICSAHFNSRAYTKADGTLSSFNKLRSLAGDIEVEGERFLAMYNHNDTIKKVVFLPKTDETPYKKFECADLGNKVYAYFDRKTGTAYVYSKADKIILDTPYHLFYGCIGLETIDFGNKGRVDFSENARSLSWMFECCRKLKTVDLSGFDFSRINDMRCMFRNCENLKSVKLGKADKIKVNEVKEMFLGCEKLESIDLSRFDTSDVKFFSSMFARCRSLKSLNLGSFNTSQATNMKNMFAQCNNLESLDLKNFDTKNTVDMRSMFEGCEKLESLDLSSFNTSALTDTYNMFGGCIGLKYLNLGSFDMSKVKDSGYMLRQCYSLRTIDAPKNAPAGIALPGEYTIDNNRDGVADSKDTYKTFPVSTVSNHLISDSDSVEIVLSEGFVRACEGDIEYHIYPGGKVVATKISAKGSVKIDTVTARGTTYKVTEIADGACKGNAQIKSLTIGNSVTRIGNEAFSGCRKLGKVAINANKKLSLGKNAFKKINKKATIKVKGVKGKAKKKLIKAIKKQTNASVK